MEGLDMVVWAVVGALALVGEVLTVSFFLLFFALGAAVALALALFGAGIALQVGGFVVASVFSMILLRPALCTGSPFGVARSTSRAGASLARAGS